MELRDILTDDVFEFFPVVVYKLLISHSQELMIPWCEIESWYFGHGKSSNSQIYTINNQPLTVNKKQ